MALGEEAKRFIVAEIKRQMEPTHSLLEDLKNQGKETHEWQLSFWSNGSGRVPGFFQRRMVDDDKWRAQMDTHKETVTQLVEDLQKAREFRELREQETKDRHKRYWSLFWKISGPVATALLGLLTWGAAKAAPVVKILIDDYLKAHPQVTEQLKNRAADSSDPSYADRQDSAMPLRYEVQK